MDKSKEFHLFFILNISLPILFFGSGYFYGTSNVPIQLNILFCLLILAANMFRSYKGKFYNKLYAIFGVLNALTFILIGELWLLSGSAQFLMIWLRSNIWTVY